MIGPMESGLLRLAMARGLLRWEDLEAVADRLPATAAQEEGDATAREGRWVRALVDAGRLTPAVVAALAADLEHTRDDLTPDLTGGDPRWARRPSGRSADPEASTPSGSAGPGFSPEYRFLADWTRYRVERRLGQGGMGTVYQAFDPSLDRYVALKFLHRNDERQTERFLREARAQARIAHPNVCQVHEVGEVLGRPFIAMQYIDGPNLGEVGRGLPLETKLAIVRDVARAVHAAHKTGLIHRDLKPGNILLARDDSGALHPFVVDFGLALEQGETGLSKTGVISGTPAYLSPEQAQGRPLDRRTDVYSLGVVLYELLAGAPPFAGANLARVLVQLVQEEPRPLRQIDPTLPEDLETLVAKCLEKDPTRRYDSARDLAEDLDRFLDGEPILARPPGWSYRVGKRLRKHRALAAVSAAALLALLALGAASLVAAGRARERAELAQRFGRQIGELQSSMKYEAFLPPHDITPHKRRLREGMEAIRSEMKRLGKVAEGPGSFALGQGYLALHQYETARTHLERAWRSGERGPEIGLALGRTLAALYERTLAEVSRETGRDEIERHYRLPALAYLRQSGGDPRRSPYAAALTAFFERRYPDALAAAREARREKPEFYEAGQLEAEIAMAQGNEAVNGGRNEVALALYDQAGEVYRQLLQQVPSEAGLYGGDCERRARWVSAAMGVRPVPEDQLSQALAACDRALAVDPELADAVVQKALIFRRRGDLKASRGEEPEADFATAIRLAERALAADPQNARTYGQLAASYRLLAQWELGRGLDPTAHAEKGVDAARRAVEIQPALASAHAILGTAYLALVQIQQRRGADPRQAVEHAAESYRRALALDPQLLAAQVNLGNAWKAMAEVQVARGADPSAAVGEAVAAFQRATVLNPRFAPVYNNLGNAHLTLGEYLLTRGSDPRQALTDAARSYERAVALQPDYSLARFNLGYTYRCLGEGLLDQGQDPGPALAAADAALRDYLRANPNDADTFLEQARVQLGHARFELRRKASPAAALDQADAALAQAERVNPKYPDVFFTQAQVARYRAEATADRRQASAALSEGLDRVAKALAATPGEGRYLALRGLLLYRAAGLEAAAERRRAGAREAVAALEAGLKANPLLAREYGSVLAEARLEAGLPGPPPARLL
jgi:eukaryotic-like serine/threonine-protein kinase